MVGAAGHRPEGAVQPLAAALCLHLHTLHPGHEGAGAASQALHAAGQRGGAGCGEQPATAAGCRQDRLYLEGFPEEAEPAGAIHVAEGQPPAAGAGAVLHDTHGAGASHQRLCPHLLQEHCERADRGCSLAHPGLDRLHLCGAEAPAGRRRWLHRLRQQPAHLPVGVGAAVHQPAGTGAALRPPARPVPALAPGPPHWRGAAQRGPGHQQHQQPAQVRARPQRVTVLTPLGWPNATSPSVLAATSSSASSPPSRTSSSASCTSPPCSARGLDSSSSCA